MEDIEISELRKAINWVSNIAKQGDARIITVPKKYWENKVIDDKKIYRVFVIEIGTRKEPT